MSRASSHTFHVMAGLVPAIHVCGLAQKQDVDARDEPGHDEKSVRCLRSIQRDQSVTVCTTALTGRLETCGSFWSFTSIASYSGSVSNGVFAFMFTTL